jgi:hypothetical protein
MNKSILHFTLLFLLALFFISCDGDVHFTSAQPSTGEPLKEVPPALRGEYISDKDSLHIGTTDMSLVRLIVNTIPLADTGKIGIRKNKNGIFYFETGDHRYISKTTKDSITYVSRNQVMDYKLGKDTVLKSFNGSYWLSLKKSNADQKEEWAVMQITLHKNKLSIAIPIVPKDEKRRMQERMDKSKSNIDSAGAFSVVTPFMRSPDQAWFLASARPDQLRNLDKRGLFRPVANFIKVK